MDLPTGVREGRWLFLKLSDFRFGAYQLRFKYFHGLNGNRRIVCREACHGQQLKFVDKKIFVGFGIEEDMVLECDDFRPKSISNECFAESIATIAVAAV